MPVVRSIARNPGGQPSARARIRIRLVAGPSSTTPGYLADGTIIGTYRTAAGDNGAWQVDLPANSTIAPADTWYVVDETPANAHSVWRTAIVVPDDEGPHELADLVASTLPTPPGISPVVSVNGMTGAVALDLGDPAGTAASLVAPGPWVDLTPGTNMGHGAVNAAARLEQAGTVVRLSATLVSTGTVTQPATVATLPVGHRPVRSMVITLRQQNSQVNYTVNVDGTLVTTSNMSGAGIPVLLDGVTFSRDR